MDGVSQCPQLSALPHKASRQGRHPIAGHLSPNILLLTSGQDGVREGCTMAHAESSVEPCGRSASTWREAGHIGSPPF